MGFRFHKSIKIAPGVKLNINKKSMGISVGGKGVRYSVNTKGKSSTTFSIPGTGIYYTETSGGKHKNGKKSKKVKNTVVMTESQYKAELKRFAEQQEKQKQQEEQSKIRQAHKQYIKIFFPTENPSIYFGEYTEAKLLISKLLLFFIILGFIFNKLFFVAFILCFFFCYCFKRQDNMYLKKYKQARSFFDQKNYHSCIETINFLISENKFDENLLKAKCECLCQLENTCYLDIQNDVKNIKESIKMLENTNEYTIVLEQYPILYQAMKKITTLYDKGVFKDMPEQTELKNFEDKLNTQTYYVNKAIQRDFYIMAEKAQELKTERGKENRKQKFIENLMCQKDHFSPETLNFISELSQQTII